VALRSLRNRIITSLERLDTVNSHSGSDNFPFVAPFDIMWQLPFSLDNNKVRMSCKKREEASFSRTCILTSRWRERSFYFISTINTWSKCFTTQHFGLNFQTNTALLPLCLLKFSFGFQILKMDASGGPRMFTTGIPYLPVSTGQGCGSALI
jgi:hypothetical protein